MREFQKTHYIQLLKKNKNLEGQNSSLYEENQNEFLKLVFYRKTLCQQIYYNNRNEYISLIESYLTNKIGCISLQFEFFAINRIDSQKREDMEKDFEKLSNIVIDPKSSDFSDLISELFCVCEALDFESESSELQFRASIEKIFLKIKNYSKN
jgi:hypothetical protein